MSKGGGQGSFAQMQEPGMGMDMGGFGGGVPQTQPFNDQIVRMDNQRETNIQPMPMPLMQNQGPDNIGGGLGSKGGLAMQAPQQQLGFGSSGPAMQAPQFSSPFVAQRQQQIAQRQQATGFDNPLLSQIALNNSRRNQGLEQAPIGGMPEGFAATPNSALGLNYTMEGVAGNNMFIYDQQTGERRTVKTEDVPANNPGVKFPELVYAGGNPNFDERTGEYRTGGIKPPRGPVKLQPIKMQPLPVDLESRGTVGPRFPNPDAPFGMGSKGGRGGGRGMASGIGGKGGRGGINPGGMYSPGGMYDRISAGGNPNFNERTGRYRSPQYDPRPPFIPGPRPPVFGPPRPAPGRNTQFQMPFFGSQYGRMNPYAGQFSGYGVPSNMFSFAQPHYQPYVPPSYQPPPPSMQLPPGQGDPSLNYPQNTGDQLFSGGGFRGGYGGGYGGIGGFGRYNLGLAGSQLR